MSLRVADRNLLFGFLALQTGFVAREELAAVVKEWLDDKSRGVGELLVARQALSSDECRLLSELEARHLDKHAGDVGASLAAIARQDAAIDEIWKLADLDVQATLAIATTDRRSSEPNPNPVLVDAAATFAGQRFRVLRSHAKGGLGEVFVAQDLELHREVALKEIQVRHADDFDARGRFVLEAEITGALEHPGIVPVYGLGQYSDGRPFYAMRFIRGDSLQEAADRFHDSSPTLGDATDDAKSVPATQDTNRVAAKFHSLEFRKLLGRFIDVCQAIEYAHSRGVLHRDLKPGNIMLGKFGETLVVDWGLAKVQGRPESKAPSEDVTLRPVSAGGSSATQFGAAVGTPAFMSPEQAGGQLDKLGPPSDVYSLGATLYYLLTGQPPFGKNTLSATLRKVQEGDFPPPRDLCASLPRALDSLCLKAMARLPEDRYATPAALAEDLEKWLADEPLVAHVEPVGLRARRWLRKHPRTVGSLAATLLVGLVSLAVTSLLVAGKNRELEQTNTKLSAANKAERQAKSEAEARRTEAIAAETQERLAKLDAEAKRKEAEIARDETTQVLHYLVASFRKPDPAADGEKLTVAELLGQAATQIAASFPEQPLIQAKLLFAIGETYRGLGLYQKSVAIHEQALDLLRAELGADSDSTQAALGRLALAYLHVGRVEESLELQEKVLEHSQGRMGAEHADTLNAMHNLASAYLDAGNFSQALALFERLLPLSKAKLGLKNPQTLATMGGLAVAYESSGRLPEALALHEQTVALKKRELGPDHPDTLVAISNLAGAYRLVGRRDESLALLEKLKEPMLSRFGPEHPYTLQVMNNISAAYYRAGRFAEALPIYEQTLTLRQARLGPDHPHILESLHGLAMTYDATKQPTKAIPLWEQSLELEQAKLGPDHADTLLSLNNLGVSQYSAGRKIEAIANLQQALALKKARLGPDDPSTISSMDTLASIYHLAGRYSEAIELMEETQRLMKAKLGAEHADTQAVTQVLTKWRREFDARQAAVKEPAPLPTAADRTIAEWVQSLGGRVNVEVKAERFDIPAASPLPTEPFLVRVVALRDCKTLADDDLAQLAELPGLVWIDLDGSAVTDKGLVHLSRLKRVRGLGLWAPGVTDDGLAHLAALTQLESLGLGHSKVTESGLAKLAALKNLRRLDLDALPITDAGLAHLDELPALAELRLVGTKITDSGLVRISHLTKLRVLFLDNTDTTDGGLAHLRDLPNLISLSLARTKISSAGLAHLAGLKTLTSLKLTETAVSDESVADLQAALPDCKIEHRKP